MNRNLVPDTEPRVITEWEAERLDTLAQERGYLIVGLEDSMWKPHTQMPVALIDISDLSFTGHFLGTDIMPLGEVEEAIQKRSSGPRVPEE